MSDFCPPRNRDAWSTIRGYTYQVNLTIQRWLDLKPNQMLELERGEDIDLVSQALIASSSEEKERLLEQVKHRDSNVTLRKPEAIAAIANFIEHCQANPNIELFFLFTTNAKIGKETLSPMPNRIPAIEAWERLRIGKVEEEKQDELLEGIRQILQKATKPDDLQEDTWQNFCSFRQNANNEQFLNLIHKFQWTTQASEADSLKSRIQQKLLDSLYAIDMLQAQEQYHRLFWYVFNCLCKPGTKQLTLEERDTQLSLPSLSNNDHATLEILKLWFNELDSRFAALEQGQQQSSQILYGLSTQVKQLATEQGINRAFNYIIETPVLDPYPLTNYPSLRQKTVQNLAQTVIQHTWTAIDGSLGSGKTQLVVLLVQYLQLYTRCLWLRFRDLTVEQACLRLDRVVEQYVNHPLGNNLSQCYSELIDCLSTIKILVLDDLPRMGNGDNLEIRLIHLAQICRSKHIYLLSTSFHELPQNLQSILGKEILYTLKSPPFTDSEAVELFQAYGAPEDFIPLKGISYLNALANHNTTLLSAIANYLHKTCWEIKID